MLPPPPHEQPDFPIQFGNWKEFVTEETREDLYTVVELLIPNFEIDQSFIRQACKYIRSCIGSIAIDLFIVKWTPLHDIDENDDNELEYLVSKLSPLWRQVESCVSSGHVKSVGISTRSAKVLSAVWRLAAVKPEAVFYEPRESEEKGLRDLNMLSQNLGFKVYLNRETPGDPNRHRFFSKYLTTSLFFQIFARRRHFQTSLSQPKTSVYQRSCLQRRRLFISGFWGIPSCKSEGQSSSTKATFSWLPPSSSLI